MSWPDVLLRPVYRSFCLFGLVLERVSKRITADVSGRLDEGIFMNDFFKILETFL